MKKMNMKDFWKSLETAQKIQLRIDIAKKSGKSIDTVLQWMLGYRTPSKLEHEALIKYIKENFNIEIVEEEEK